MERTLGGKIMKVFRRVFYCLFICALLVGCNMNEQGNEHNQSGEVDNRQQGARNVGNALGNPNTDFMNNTINMKNTTTRTNNTSRLRVADEAQNQVESLFEVKHATIIVLDRNAYVAVVMDKDFNGEVSSRIQDEIAAQVRSTDSTIRNVFVSSNPDFVESMSEYGDKIRSGKSNTGLEKDFSKMVRGVFPRIISKS
jgi:YhcN/YlaJ family sporulation lipoprotein